jgi:hypothetical protein
VFFLKLHSRAPSTSRLEKRDHVVKPVDKSPWKKEDNKDAIESSRHAKSKCELPIQ